MKPEQVTFPRSLHPEPAADKFLEMWGDDQLCGVPISGQVQNPCLVILHDVSDRLLWDLLEGR